MTESWGKKVKRIAPKLDEIKVAGKWFILRDDGILVLKSKHDVAPQK